MELRDLPSVDELARDVDDPLAVDAARAVLAPAPIPAICPLVCARSWGRCGLPRSAASSTRPA